MAPAAWPARNAQRKGLEKDIWSTPMQYGPAKSMTTPRLSQMPVCPTTGRKEVMPGRGHHTMAKGKRERDTSRGKGGAPSAWLRRQRVRRSISQRAGDEASEGPEWWSPSIGCRIGA